MRHQRVQQKAAVPLMGGRHNFASLACWSKCIVVSLHNRLCGLIDSAGISTDLIHGSGLRNTPPCGTPNSTGLPGYDTANAVLTHKWKHTRIGTLDGRLSIVNRRRPTEFVVPNFIPVEELAQYLWDLFRENATPMNNVVTQIK